MNLRWIYEYKMNRWIEDEDECVFTIVNHSNKNFLKSQTETIETLISSIFSSLQTL